jgi:hypothetical protein
MTAGYTGSVSGATMAAVFDPWIGAFAHKVTANESVSLNNIAGVNASTGQGMAVGNAFTFFSNTQGFRPIAGCLRFENYTASNTIGGKCGSMAPVPHSMSYAINNTTSDMSYLSSNVEYTRIPLSAEVIWRPPTNNVWSKRATPITVYADPEENQSIAIILSMVGGAAASFDFSIIAEFVYEYIPSMASGIPPKQINTTSMNTAEQVNSYLGNAVFSNIGDQAMGAAQQAGKLLGSGIYAYNTYRAARRFMSSPTPYQLE